MEEAGEQAAEGQRRPGAAEPGRSWTPLLTSGRPQREYVCGQPGRDLERQHQEIEPTRSLEPTIETKESVLGGSFPRLITLITGVILTCGTNPCSGIFDGLGRREESLYCY